MFGPSVNDGHPVSAHPEASSRAVDGRVAAADHYGVLTHLDFAAEIDVSQEVNAPGKHPLDAVIFLFEAERRGLMRAYAQKYGFETRVEQALDREILPSRAPNEVSPKALYDPNLSR